MKTLGKTVRVVLKGVTQVSVCEAVVLANVTVGCDRHIPAISVELLDVCIKGRLRMGIRYDCVREAVMRYRSNISIVLHWRT